jgi:hypothetical protein
VVLSCVEYRLRQTLEVRALELADRGGRPGRCWTIVRRVFGLRAQRRSRVGAAGLRSSPVELAVAVRPSPVGEFRLVEVVWRSRLRGPHVGCAACGSRLRVAGLLTANAKRYDQAEEEACTTIEGRPLEGRHQGGHEAARQLDTTCRVVRGDRAASEGGDQSDMASDDATHASAVARVRARRTRPLAAQVASPAGPLTDGTSNGRTRDRERLGRSAGPASPAARNAACIGGARTGRDPHRSRSRRAVALLQRVDGAPRPVARFTAVGRSSTLSAAEVPRAGAGAARPSWSGRRGPT